MDNKKYHISEFITCNTMHVVFALQCLCSLQYVDSTKHPLRKHIAEYVQNIVKGFKHHSVSLHFREVHGRDSSGLQFWGVDRIHPS